ncbi:MAG: hydrogenase formation protein HypD [Nitrospirae bacterium]|nr:hydrogenase formation protein HypD [Nitrospirota bacterium]
MSEGRLLREYVKRLAQRIGRPVRLMEVCGTHTVSIFRHGIRAMLPEGVDLLSGPGCPVCVTSIEDIDWAIAFCKQVGGVIATFGDMMKVPGSDMNFFQARAEGADIRFVYSPVDALNIAVEEPDKEVVFFATGFETTSPTVAAVLKRALDERVGNFYIYSVHKLVPPALKALVEDKEVRVDGFILPGHVSTIIGSRGYEFLARQYKLPGVITGFSPEEIMQGIAMLLEQILQGRAEIEIQYKKVVRPEGNPQALRLLEDVFTLADSYWRGIGMIPQSGLEPAEQYSEHDAKQAFRLEFTSKPEPRGCSCGEVLRGVKKPTDCPLFRKVCTPERPVGACMVSTEGSCAAYYKYSY